MKRIDDNFNDSRRGAAPLAMSDYNEKESKEDSDSFHLNDDTYQQIPDQFKNLSEDPDLQKEDSSSEEEKKPERDRANEPPAPPFKNSKTRRESAGDGNSSGSERNRPKVPPFLVFILLAALVWFFVSLKKEGKSTLISWNGFCEQLEKGNIDTVNMKGNVLTGTFSNDTFTKSSDFAKDWLGQLLPNPVFQKGNKSETDRWELRQVPAKGKNPDESFTFGGENFSYAVVDKTAENRPTGVIIYRRFKCEIPVTALADSKLDAHIRQKANKSFSSTTPLDNSGIYMISSILLSLFLFFFIWKMMRRTNDQMMGGGINGFAKSPMKRYSSKKGKVTFSQVAGLENVKKELEEIVDYLKNPEKYHKMGACVPKGTLLCGPPGTGKTLLARAVAGEAGVPFFSINGSEFMQMFVGVGAQRVREIFSAAREEEPSILFIDEIDAVGRQRGTGLGGGHDEREQTLNQILSEMDGFVQTESVMVMAATNRPDVLDPALMRPGRFDRHVTVDRPSLKGRKEIFDVYLAKIPVGQDVDRDKLAAATVGFTGADIKNLVNEAALWATRNNKTVVEMADFEFAHAKVIMGLPREENITPENKRKTAYHEAGHTILDWFSPTKTKVHKVTILPRGMSLGATYILPEEDQLNINEDEIRAKLAEYLAGRTAEMIVYNLTSTGAENDLKEATHLARRMVVHWGMSEKLGPVSYRSEYSNPFLGKEIAESREYSEATARLIDEEVSRILREAEEAAKKLLTEKRDLLDKLTDALVEEEELDQARIQEILGPPA